MVGETSGLITNSEASALVVTVSFIVMLFLWERFYTEKMSAKIVKTKFHKIKPIRSRIFGAFCDEKGSSYTTLPLHTEVANTKF
jgi:hypothetical protein